MADLLFKVGDYVRLNASGRIVYGNTSKYPPLDGVVITAIKWNSGGHYILWDEPMCGGCYFFHLEAMEGPW